jgi:hypothetical protein
MEGSGRSVSHKAADCVDGDDGDDEHYLLNLMEASTNAALYSSGVVFDRSLCRRSQSLRRRWVSSWANNKVSSRTNTLLLTLLLLLSW